MNISTAYHVVHNMQLLQAFYGRQACYHENEI